MNFRYNETGTDKTGWKTVIGQSPQEGGDTSRCNLTRANTYRRKKIENTEKGTWRGGGAAISKQLGKDVRAGSLRRPISNQKGTFQGGIDGSWGPWAF